MFNLFCIRKFLDDAIVETTQMIHDRIFLTAGFDANDDLITVFPFFKVLGDQFDRILKIADHGDRTITCCLQDAVIRRVELSEILGIKDGFDLWIGSAYLTQQRAGIIAGIIVNKEKFIIILCQLICK